MTDPTQDLDQLSSRLEDAAARLRAGDLDSDEAAELVEECARIAAQAGAELDRRTRGGSAPGQDSLL